MKATFGAGCFWGVEAQFRALPGVLDTEVGYAGGWTEHPSYEEVCSGETGHAEVVQVTYDPQQISYEELLDFFWSIHNPALATKAQYRSLILTHNVEQQQLATKKRCPGTEIAPLRTYYRAEEYHQRYQEKHKY